MLKVAQCWDDGVATDARLAGILRKHKAKATFNLNPGLNKRSERVSGWSFQDFPVYKLSLNEMRDVYTGFCLASHTMTHPDARNTESEVFVQSALDARKFIEDYFQCEALGFAWPYGTYTEETVSAMKEVGFKYARITGHTDNVLSYTDPMLLTPSCHFLDADFWMRFEHAKKTGIFYFWGHSYEMKDDPTLWSAFEENIARLSADPEVCWIDVIDIVS